jgi:hypothetical protein
MKRTIQTGIVCGLLLGSCQYDEDIAPVGSDYQVDRLGKRFGNAFTVSNVEKAVNNLLQRKANGGRIASVSLTPTHYYYKLNPQNHDQLIEMEQEGYDYWDVPLDYDIPETLSPLPLEEFTAYQDPILGPNQITYHYTLVPRGGVIPIAKQASRLDELFLFDEDAGDEWDGEDPDIKPEDIPDHWEPQPFKPALCADDNGMEYNCLEHMARKPETQKFNRLYEGTVFLLSLGINLKELYNEIMILSGNEDELIDLEEKPAVAARRYYPEGSLYVEDNSIGRNVPIKYTRVKARRWFKLSKTYTNASGKFRIGKGFRKKATILVKFKNGNATIRGINGKLIIWQYIWPVKKNLGTFSRSSMQSLNYTFKYSADAHSNTARYWTAAVAINAVYEMNQLCSRFGISTPPSNLNVWLSSKVTKKASAPMLRRIGHTSDVVKAIQLMLGVWGAATIEVVKKVVPDITYNYVRNERCEEFNLFFRTMLHELAHGVHYRKAGNNYWASYIAYIVKEGGYGSHNSGGVGHCAVGEAWAYYLDNTFRREYYAGFSGNIAANIRVESLRQLENHTPTTSAPVNRFSTGSEGWIPFGMLHDMTDTGETIASVNDAVNGYSVSGIYKGFTSGSTSVSKLTSNILAGNGNRQLNQVNTLRKSYGW